ncbi:MAG: ROK family transcriptional regulator [Candidatus Omnitrophica bacterium]|nr:ROK family transcriptional regulator [Candidatus Omnitrophota bacterium]MBU4590696.1 ROK family transcriptional regulator [Candidatus Omnitrophota bacterium]
MAIKKNRFFESHSLSDHEKKNFSILELVRRNGPITRADISKITDLNIVTVSNYINTYINEGLVAEGGMEASSGGRKPTLVKLREDHGHAMGLDLGHTGAQGATMVGLVTDLSGRIIARIEKPREKDSMDRIIDKSLDLIEELMNKKGVSKDRVKGVGIAVGGVIDDNLGTVRDSSKDGIRTSYISIKGLIEQRFGMPSFLGNDATFAAFGEKMYALPMDIEDVVYMYSDVGSGIIIKGGIYCGASGSAGEIRINYPRNGEYLRLSKNLSFLLPLGLDLGLVSQAKKLIKEESVKSNIAGSSAKDLNKITVEGIIESAKSGDTLAIELLEDAAVNMGVRVAYLINLFNPEIVIIGGGIEKSGSLFLEPLRRTVRKWAFEEPANAVKIIPAHLGKDSAALGAASVVIKDVFIKA